MVSQMLVIDNFCHGDLHHGNWKIRPVQIGASLDYQIIVYDYGICFSASDVRINRVIMESFENNDSKKILEVITELIEGNFDDAVIQSVEQAVYHYREDSLDLVHLFNTINNILVRYNCKLTANGTNTVLLLSLIDTTLRKHNLIGGNAASSALPRTTPSSIIRSKNLDLIAYAKSRGAYPAYVQYVNAKHAHSRDYNTVGLFAGSLNNNLVLDPPE
jgi:hypothetical protein